MIYFEGAFSAILTLFSPKPEAFPTHFDSLWVKFFDSTGWNLLSLIPGFTHTLRSADTFHKPGFKMHAKILHHLFEVVKGSVIKAPLWDVATLGLAGYPSNAVFVHEYVTKLLSSSFPNMRPAQVQVCKATPALDF